MICDDKDDDDVDSQPSYDSDEDVEESLLYLPFAATAHASIYVCVHLMMLCGHFDSDKDVDNHLNYLENS